MPDQCFALGARGWVRHSLAFLGAGDYRAAESASGVEEDRRAAAWADFGERADREREILDDGGVDPGGESNAGAACDHDRAADRVSNSSAAFVFATAGSGTRYA